MIQGSMISRISFSSVSCDQLFIDDGRTNLALVNFSDFLHLQVFSIDVFSLAVARTPVGLVVILSLVAESWIVT